MSIFLSLMMSLTPVKVKVFGGNGVDINTGKSNITRNKNYLLLLCSQLSVRGNSLLENH